MTESSGSSENLATDPDAPADAPLPRPFDAGLGSNYTSDSCPAFIRKFLASSEFQKCLPLSLLLQNSNSFFKAEKSITRITQVLDSICDADFNSCSALMSSLAEGLRQEENCAADYEAENSLVIQAYNGLVSFDSLFQAGCLRSSSGSYCFADAITNFSSPSDSYIYFIPLGVPLPGASRPSCNECLKKSMSFFSNFASNASEPVSTT
ncbi:MAG: hypothetical protein M1833_002903, partial [Piccolia ochrophora]